MSASIGTGLRNRKVNKPLERRRDTNTCFLDHSVTISITVLCGLAAQVVVNFSVLFGTCVVHLLVE